MLFIYKILINIAFTLSPPNFLDQGDGSSLLIPVFILTSA